MYHLIQGLDLESLDLVLQASDLAHQVGCLVGGDACCDDSSADTTCTSQSSLGWYVNVRGVLVFAEKGKVEKNSQWGSIGGEDNNFTDTTVEGLGGLVGSLLQLTVMLSLLNEIEDLLGESAVGDGPSSRFVLFFSHCDFGLELSLNSLEGY